EVMKEMAGQEPSVQTVSDIIGKDPGMTAKMLQLVNSAAVGLSRKVMSPFEAVQFLGMNTVRSLVLSAHIFSRFEHDRLKGLSAAQQWTHAMRTSQLASRILHLEQADAAAIEEANIAGMLHDMGKLMLADGLPDEYQEALQLAAEGCLSVEQAELQILG